MCENILFLVFNFLLDCTYLLDKIEMDELRTRHSFGDLHYKMSE